MQYMVYIHNKDYARCIEIAFVKQDEETGQRYIAKPVKIEFQEIKPHCEDTKPTMTLCGITADKFLQAMAEALDRKNIKTDKDAKIEGTLESTRFHLEDLRHLLKLPKNEETTNDK